MRKNLFYTLPILAFIWFLSLTINIPITSAAYTPIIGDLIKTATDSAIYYIDTDKKRHLFVNSATFWTWYTGSWSSIKFDGNTKTLTTISQTDFDNIDTGNHITARPGAKIIKFQNSPKIYIVTTGSKLALIPDTTTAESKFGANWATKIIIIQNGFENDYIKENTPTATTNTQCSSYMHLENNICISNNKTCDISHGIAKYTWLSNNSWGACTIQSCETGYVISSDGAKCEVKTITNTIQEIYDPNVGSIGSNILLTWKSSAPNISEYSVSNYDGSIYIVPWTSNNISSFASGNPIGQYYSNSVTINGLSANTGYSLTVRLKSGAIPWLHVSYMFRN